MNMPSSRSRNVRSSPPWIIYIYIYIYDCCRLPLGNIPIKCWVMHYIVALKRLKHPLYRISKISTSLFVHYFKGNVLEDLPRLVDFIVKLNVNYKQRGAISKLQHFVGNQMSRDIMMLVLGDPIEWMFGCSISSFLEFIINLAQYHDSTVRCLVDWKLG